MMFLCFNQLSNPVAGVLQIMLGKIECDGIEQFTAAFSALSDLFNLAAGVCHR